ncbi:MAG: ABC transporter transmembrane domain-containing protein, partial [Dictyoglomus sp.]
MYGKPLLRHIRKLIWQYKWKYLLGAFFLLITDIFQLISPRILGWGVDYLNKGSLSFKSLLLVFLALLVLSLLTAFFRFLWRIQIIATSRRLEAQIREKYFIHLQTLSLNYFNHHKTG